MSQSSAETAEGGTVVIAATFAAEPLEAVLCFWLKTLGLPLTVRFAAYNQVFQELLSPSSDFHGNRSGVNVLLIRLEDYARVHPSGSEAGSASGVREVLTRTVRELSEAVAGFVEQSRVPLLIGLLPVSEQATAGWDFASQALVDELAGNLSGLPRVTLLSPAECACYAPDTCFDPIQDELGHVPYTSEYFAALGTALARKIHALKVPARKVLVLDCDNTLWKGVVGEDGIDGIGLSGGFLALQRFASEQHAQGTLICLCSKNAEQDVLDVFEKRDEMQLKSEQIVAHRINWQSKVENLVALAEELNLGLDSFVFIDDSAVECGQIREALPQVLTLELPKEDELDGFLRNLWLFDKVATTDVDKARTQLYRDNVARYRFQRQSGSIGDFIRGLNLQIEIQAPKPEDWSRLSQLTQRTNQFNFTTVRRHEAELQALVDQGADCLCVRVRDRFGDYGLVGMVISLRRGEDLWVDTWLLSCRVLGRGVEHAMLRRVGELAFERRLSNVVLELRPTAKNTPARLFADSVASDYKIEREGVIEYRIPRDVAQAAEHQPGSAHEERMAAAGGEGGQPSTPLPATRVVAPYESIARSLGSACAVNQAVLAARPRRRRLSTLQPPQAKSELEAGLVRAFEDLLGVDGIDVEDDFFELGGTSLIAVALFSRLAKQYGARLPLTTIMEAPTVRALARRLDPSQGGRSDTTTIELGRGAGPTALFLIHDGDGEILLYRGLSRLLPPHIAVFGLSPKRLPGIPLAHASIAEMAAYQVEQVRRLRPHGPYLLGGLCAGGAIAMEMAAQLERAGETVALVALFDSASPTAHRKAGLVTARRLGRARELLKSRDAAAPWPKRALDVVSTAAARTRNVARYELAQGSRRLSDALRFRLLRLALVHGAGWPSWLPSLSIRAIVNQAEAMHSPSRVQRAHVVLFRATEAAGQPGFRHLFEEPCFGWSEHVDGNFTAIDVPGDHSTLLQEPHVEAVARELIALLPSRYSETEIEQYPELDVAAVSESSMPASAADELLRAG